MLTFGYGCTCVSFFLQRLATEKKRVQNRIDFANEKGKRDIYPFMMWFNWKLPQRMLCRGRYYLNMHWGSYYWGRLSFSLNWRSNYHAYYSCHYHRLGFFLLLFIKSIQHCHAAEVLQNFQEMARLFTSLVHFVVSWPLLRKVNFVQSFHPFSHPKI